MTLPPRSRGSNDALISRFFHTVGKLRTGDMLAWALFCVVCLQMGFHFPYQKMFPDIRENPFFGICCLIPLIVTLLTARTDSLRSQRPELIISGILAVLAIMSGLLSDAPLSSSIRSFNLVACSLSGFWTARILLASPARQRYFVWLCLGILTGMVLLSGIGYGAFGKVERFLDSGLHPIANRMILLSFAPICLIMLSKELRVKCVAVGVLLGSIVIFYLSNLRAAMLAPILMAITALGFRAIRLRHFLIMGLAAAIIVPFFIAKLPQVKIGKEYEPAYYRIENYPFSLHIAAQHPFLGIGLRAPRSQYLKDYDIKYPYVTKKKFAASVNRITTSENSFLNFVTDLGFPFALIYTASILWLFVLLARAARNPSDRRAIPPLALLLPLSGAAVHYLVFDGLLYAQLDWYFHVLLGLAPMREVVLERDSDA